MLYHRVHIGGLLEEKRKGGKEGVREGGIEEVWGGSETSPWGQGWWKREEGRKRE